MTPTTPRHAKAALLLLAAALAPGMAAALDLELPAGARLMTERTTDPGSYAVPTGPWSEEAGIPVNRVEGAIRKQSWRIEASDLTTLQILSPLRDQIEASDYEIVFQCSAAGCGGFDFRFDTEVLPAPAMYVDLTAFRFLSARGPDGSWLSLLVSRSNAAGYVQLIRAGGQETTAAEVGTGGAPVTADGNLLAELEARGHVILNDVTFGSGAAALGEETIASLDTLAAYLAETPSRRVVLVGHTDAVGSLEANTALSRERAQAAAAYLRDRGVPGARISSDGVGYLAPVASNLTDAGREANRRVEAVLLPVE